MIPSRLLWITARLYKLKASQRDIFFSARVALIVRRKMTALRARICSGAAGSTMIAVR